MRPQKRSLSIPLASFSKSWKINFGKLFEIQKAITLWGSTFSMINYRYSANFLVKIVSLLTFGLFTAIMKHRKGELKNCLKYFPNWGTCTKTEQHDFEKLARGIERDLFWGLICGKSVADSRNLMKPFSLPYECIFHLVYFVFSPNTQFWHSNIFEHLIGYTHVIKSNLGF